MDRITTVEQSLVVRRVALLAPEARDRVLAALSRFFRGGPSEARSIGRPHLEDALPGAPNPLQPIARCSFSRSRTPRLPPPPAPLRMELTLEGVELVVLFEELPGVEVRTQGVERAQILKSFASKAEGRSRLGSLQSMEAAGHEDLRGVGSEAAGSSSGSSPSSVHPCLFFPFLIHHSICWPLTLPPSSHIPDVLLFPRRITMSETIVKTGTQREAPREILASEARRAKRKEVELPSWNVAEHARSRTRLLYGAFAPLQEFWALAWALTKQG